MFLSWSRRAISPLLVFFYQPKAGVHDPCYSYRRLFQLKKRGVEATYKKDNCIIVLGIGRSEKKSIK
jgi:hypothetical protein